MPKIGLFSLAPGGGPPRITAGAVRFPVGTEENSAGAEERISLSVSLCPCVPAFRNGESSSSVRSSMVTADRAASLCTDPDRLRGRFPDRAGDKCAGDELLKATLLDWLLGTDCFGCSPPIRSKEVCCGELGWLFLPDYGLIYCVMPTTNTHIKRSQSTWCQADFHRLSTSYQRIKFARVFYRRLGSVFVRAQAPAEIAIFPIVMEIETLAHGRGFARDIGDTG